MYFSSVSGITHRSPSTLTKFLTEEMSIIVGEIMHENWTVLVILTDLQVPQVLSSSMVCTC
jgi:hypothetical protein